MIKLFINFCPRQYESSGIFFIFHSAEATVLGSVTCYLIISETRETETDKTQCDIVHTDDLSTLLLSSSMSPYCDLASSWEMSASSQVTSLS